MCACVCICARTRLITCMCADAFLHPKPVRHWSKRNNVNCFRFKVCSVVPTHPPTLQWECSRTIFRQLRNDLFCVKLAKQWHCFIAKKKKKTQWSKFPSGFNLPSLTQCILQCTVFLNYSRKFCVRRICSMRCECVSHYECLVQMSIMLESRVQSIQIHINWKISGVKWVLRYTVQSFGAILACNCVGYVGM